MGDGIISHNGVDPNEEWETRINNLGSPTLSGCVRDLLAGNPVSSVTGGVQIAAGALASPEAHAILVASPGAKYPAQLVVEAKPANVIFGIKADPRSSIPSPTSWMTSTSATEQTWELFNCVVYSVRAL